MKEDSPIIPISKSKRNLLFGKPQALKYLDISSSLHNKNIILTPTSTKRRVHSDKKIKLLSIKVPQLNTYANLSAAIKPGEHLKPPLEENIIDELLSKDNFLENSRKRSRNIGKSTFYSSLTKTKGKFPATQSKLQSRTVNQPMNKLLLANINISKKNEVDSLVFKGRLKRYSIVDKLLFQVTQPERAIEDYYRNNDIRPGDKYALFKKQLISKRNRLTDIINDIKKTQSMNESRLKVFLTKLNYAKIKALTHNMNKS